jgi:hypothetical protein
MAGAHGVIPLLYARRDDLGQVPSAARERLEIAHRCIRMRNLLLSETLVRIIEMLGKSGVEALSFKGPALAAAAYGEIGMRQFDDLDILVRPRDRVRAARALHDYPSSFGRHGTEVADFFLCHEEPLELGRGLGTLDLHWGLNPSYFDYAPPIEELFARAQGVVLAGRRVPAPATEDALLIVCVHAARHGWSRLNWLCDVAYLALRCTASDGGADWERLLNHATRLGCRRMLLLGLYLAGWLLRTPLPRRMRAAMDGDAVMARIATRAASALFASPVPVQGWRQDFLLPLLGLERGAQRWRFAAHRLLSPTLVDWSALPLPRVLFGLYYLLRPVRLMAHLARHG